MSRSKSKVVCRVREMRRAHGGMTQQDLAERIAVSRQTIIAIEQGRFSPSLESALRLAQVFDVAVEALFSLESE